MAGKKTPTTLNGNNINDGSIYVSTFNINSSIGDVFESTVVTAEIARQFDQYVGSQPQGRVLTMRTKLMRFGTSNHYADMTQLKKWCSSRQGEIVLKATDQATSPLTLRLTVKPLACVPLDGYDGIYETRFWVSKPVWENDTADDSTQTVDSTAELWTITNDGSDTVEPRITITPNHYKAAANGPIYQKRIVVAPRSAQPHQDAYGNPYPFELTGGGWAGLETHRKNGVVHPAGYDIRVFVDDVEVPRYISGMGTGFGGGTDADSGGTFKTWETTDNDSFHGQRFRIGGCSENEQITVDDLRLFLKKTGLPTGNLIVEIRTESAGLPSNTVVTNGTSNALDVSTLTTSFVEKTFTFAVNPVLTAETWYWLVIKPPTGTHSASAYVTMADTLIDATVGANLEGEYFTSAHATATTGTWYRGADLVGQGDHGITDQLIIIDFRIYTTHNAKIWTPIVMPGMVKLTLGQALQSDATISTGKDTLYVADAEGAARLPDRTAVVIGTECLILNGKVGTDAVRIVKRAARGTTLAAHDAGTAVYWVPFDIRLVYGQANFDDLGKPEYEPRAHAPVIDGITSTNEQFKWIGPFLGIDEETRPMVWRPESDDTVDLDEYVTLDMDASNDDTDITFKDALPSGAYLQRNVLTQHLPTSIEAAASAVTVTELIPDALVLAHLLTNARGEEELIDTHRSSDMSPAATATVLTLTPTSPAFRHRMRVAHQVVTGTDASGEDLSVNSASPKAMLFTLEEDSTIEAIAFRVAETDTAPTTDLYIDLFKVNDDDDESVDTSVKLMDTQAITPSETSTTTTTITKTLTAALRLPAGKYAFAFTTADTNGYLLQASDGSVYAGGEARSGAQTTISIAATYDADVDDTPTIDAADTKIWVEAGGTGQKRRGVVRFPLTTLPATADVSSVQLQVEVIDTDNSQDLAVGGYGIATDAAGQVDPAVDTAADMRSRASTTAWRYAKIADWAATAGIKTLPLGGTVNTDIESAKAAPTAFALGLIHTQGGDTDQVSIASIDHATSQEPRLVITYTLAANASYTSQVPQDIWFRVYGTPASSTVPVGSAGELTLDNIIINLDDVTPQTPQVIFESADTSCVLIDGVLENTTPIRLTGAQIAEAIDAPGGPYTETAIDVSSPEPFRILPKVIQVDSEQLRTASMAVGTPNVISASRGYNSTSAINHLIDTDIYELYQTVTVKAVMQTTMELDIDWAKRTVTISDTDRADLNAFACLSDFDPEIPFRLEPGANKLKWSETGWDGTHTLSVRTRYREGYL